MTSLIPCPFCDGTPSFTDVELKDERRYAEKLLRCCSIEMSARLGWSKYKGLTDAQIDHTLRSELVKNWNTRTNHLPDLPQAVAVTDEMVTAAMRAFEPMSSVLRYREKDKWHSCDIMAMRDALKAALALSRPKLCGGDNG